MCFGGGSVPQAPNTSAQANSSSSIGQTAQTAGQNQLNWANSAVQGNQNTTSNVQSALNPLIGQQASAGTAASNQFQNQTLGALGQQLTTAQNYGSQAGMDQASANAAASTAQAYQAARQNNMQQLGSYGVDPSQLKSGALNLNANLQQAGAVGNAAYNAGQARQQAGMALTSQALGQNLQAANVGQGYTSGANATGSNIVGLGNQTTATGSSALTAPSTMLSTGLSGYGTSANIENQNFQNQLASYQAQQAGANALASGLGQVAGLGLMNFASSGNYANLADGGSPIPRRYAGGGMVYTPGGPYIMQGATYQAPQQSFGQGLGLGAQEAQRSGIAGQSPSAVAQQQFGSPAMQAQRNQMNQAASDGLPTLPTTFANGGPIPQRKRMDYGNPAVHPSHGVPPQVGIPGPWVAADGGTGPGFVGQGPSDGTGIDDQVPARVSVGEYIIPADVVHSKGKEFFDKLLQRYHVPAQQQRQQMGMHQ